MALVSMWTNVNCSSALTHQVPRISLSDPAPLNILHSTKVKPRTRKYKEESYIAGPPEGHTHLSWKIDRDDRYNTKRRPARSHCSKETGWRLANWSELPKTPPPSSLPPNCTCSVCIAWVRLTSHAMLY